VTTAARKKSSRRLPAKEPPTPVGRAAEVPLLPVTPKIGETSGNLQARSAAFKRRRGTKS
jgi:hypothetical protein